MIFVNELFKLETLPRKAWEPFVLLLGPYAPHLAEELWEKLKHPPSISLVPFPEWDEELAKDEEVTIVIQVNGKVRAKIQANAGLSEEELKTLALNQQRIQDLVNGKTPKKIITVPDKLVNIVL